jgi:hypothetical protein
MPVRTALVKRSAGSVSVLFCGERHHRRAATTPTLLRLNTQNGSETPKAAMANPPSAGPAARLRLKPTLLAATALSRSCRGTCSGVMASQAGALRAPATPRRKVVSNSETGVASPNDTMAANIADMTIVAISMAISIRLESMTSARAPAGKVNKNNGSVTAT